MTTSELCSCGRIAAKNHCPFCGAQTVYAKSSLSRIDQQTGDVIMAYRCRRCGKEFDDSMRQLCKAPVTGPAGRGKALLTKVDEAMLALPLEERRRLMRERLSSIKLPGQAKNDSPTREEIFTEKNNGSIKEDID